MVFFYIAVAYLAIAGLIGGLQLSFIKNSASYINIIGILIIILGLLSFIRYSYRAVTIRQDQFKIK